MSDTATVPGAVRAAIAALGTRERVAYVGFLVARALIGFLDVAGIVVIGVVASLAATGFDASGGSPVAVLGIELPAFDESTLLALVAAALGLFVAKAVVAVLMIRAQSYFVARVETRVADRLIGFVLAGDLVEAKRASKAELQFTLTDSLVYAFTGLLNNVATLVAESFLVFVIAVTFVAVNPAVSLFTLVYFAIVVLLIQFVIGRRVKRAAVAAASGTIDTINSVADVLDAFREVTVLGKQSVFGSAISASRGRIARSNATMTYLVGMPRYVVETALILGVLLLVAQQLLAGSLAAGLVTIGVFLAGGVRMMSSLLPLQTALANIRNNAEQARPALDLLARVPADPVDHPAPSDVAREPGGLAVEISGVAFTYPGASRPAVDGVSLSIEAGAQVAIIGPSGAGKTTLVDLVLGLVKPDSGAVAIGGRGAAELRLEQPGAVAYVPQRPGIVSGTIAENIALGVPAADVDAERLQAAVDAAHLREFVDSLPDGLDTSVGKQTDALSGGQMQRIGVARALYTRPRLLVLDEATSGLDASSEEFVAASLRALRGQVTVVVIAHRLSTVQHADAVVVVDEGRVVAEGDFATVRREVPMVAEYVKLMSFDEGGPA